MYKVVGLVGIVVLSGCAPVVSNSRMYYAERRGRHNLHPEDCSVRQDTSDVVTYLNESQCRTLRRAAADNAFIAGYRLVHEINDIQ